MRLCTSGWVKCFLLFFFANHFFFVWNVAPIAEAMHVQCVSCEFLGIGRRRSSNEIYKTTKLRRSEFCRQKLCNEHPMYGWCTLKSLHIHSVDKFLTFTPPFPRRGRDSSEPQIQTCMTVQSKWSQKEKCIVPTNFRTCGSATLHTWHK